MCRFYSLFVTQQNKKTMEPNVTLIEAIVRFVITMILAILAVYLDMFIFMAVALLVMVSALAQWCPMNAMLGRNKHLGH